MTATIAEAPSPWTILGDHAKATMTLSSALLGISATFATNLLDTGDGAVKALLAAAWAALALSIAAAVYANGAVFSNVKSGSVAYGGSASMFLNIAFFLLTVGTALLGGAAFADTGADKVSGVEKMVSAARTAVVDAYDVEDDAVAVERYATSPEKTAQVVMTVTGTVYEVVVDLDSGDVLSIEAG